MIKKTITFFGLFLLLISSLCFASNELNLLNQDLYITDNNYVLNNLIAGNVFVSNKNFSTDASDNGGTISGNLFVKSNSVNIKSVKDENGATTQVSTIYGNVYAISDTFTLEEGCSINGDLYFYGNTLNLENSSQIGGNIFVSADNVTINSQINGSAYITSKNFNLNYDAYIFNDLNLNSKYAILNGQIGRNCKTKNNTFTSQSGFKVSGDFFATSNEINFAGEIIGNVNLNAKKITFNTNDSTCIIRGDLNYSSNSEINITSTNVYGKINHTKYKTNIGKSILNKLVSYISLLIYIFAINILLNKLFKNFVNKSINFNIKNLFVFFGLGLAFLIMLPIIIALLFILKITLVLACILLAIYFILLSLAIPVFINTLANKFKKKNIYLNILILTSILWLISLIPFVGFVFDIIITLLGFGIIIINIKQNKKC